MTRAVAPTVWPLLAAGACRDLLQPGGRQPGGTVFCWTRTARRRCPSVTRPTRVCVASAGSSPVTPDRTGERDAPAPGRMSSDDTGHPLPRPTESRNGAASRPGRGPWPTPPPWEVADPDGGPGGLRPPASPWSASRVTSPPTTPSAATRTTCWSAPVLVRAGRHPDHREGHHRDGRRSLQGDPGGPARCPADRHRHGADAPIVFTSAEPAAGAAGRLGRRDPAGAGPRQRPTPVVEGITQGGEYGGTDENDSSGALSYVRIEYSGTRLGPNNEINGLTLGGVGRATIDRSHPGPTDRPTTASSSSAARSTRST